MMQSIRNMTSRRRVERQSGRSMLACARGAIAVEFALVAPFLFFFLLAMFQISDIMFKRGHLDFAVHRVVRDLYKDPNTTVGALKSELNSLLSNFDAGNLTISTSTETVDGIDYQVLTATYIYELFMPLGDLDEIQFSATSRAPRIVIP